MKRFFGVPPELEIKIDRALRKHFNLNLQESKKLADAVKKLSDYFIDTPEGATPWKESWGQIAYLAYYLPLNHARVQAVAHEARARNFFAGLEEVVDFGAGFGTVSLALADHFRRITLVEMEKEICSRFEFLDSPDCTWLDRIDGLNNPEKTLSVFSYSLTELAEIPAWAKKSEALMIIEPSTQQDGRKLMELRQKLITAGYSMWAPCTHQKACPLLTQSKTDWCHDRILFTMPKWFETLEQHLPMKNKSLTMSYLLARKTTAAALASSTARTVGDRMKEKGKDRQMFCRGEEREFLAWMHKHGVDQEIPRGVLVKVPELSVKVSNELRITDIIEII
jgi:ribosomal protein RSM22 (predicted rRNA methylase)